MFYCAHLNVLKYQNRVFPRITHLIKGCIENYGRLLIKYSVNSQAKRPLEDRALRLPFLRYDWLTRQAQDPTSTEVH